ncbi:hypothetical protein UPYG_G00221560 [Umbra pygmaea]|uniref:DUF7869 domain-containing protein n=1 Tax=Umbra pygmaea TaxID=75934 RepID=A0ABD0WXL6_UMBPY
MAASDSVVLFDFAQQVHYPSDPMEQGPMYLLSPHNYGLFGVCWEVIPQQLNYLILEGMSSSKGSSAVINYLHHFFNRYRVGETCVDLHCDNCSRQNKNKFVLWYCAWRTMHKLHHCLELHFLIAGHTKFAPDWCFRLIKQCFRKTRVNTLSDIAGVVKDSTVTGVNILPLVGLEDGTVLVESYDWQHQLTPYFRPLSQINQYQHFRFTVLMLSSLGLFLPRSAQTHLDTVFSCCATLLIFLHGMVCHRLPFHHLDGSGSGKELYRCSRSYIALEENFFSRKQQEAQHLHLEAVLG